MAPSSRCSEQQIQLKREYLDASARVNRAAGLSTLSGEQWRVFDVRKPQRADIDAFVAPQVFAVRDARRKSSRGPRDSAPE